MASFYSFAALPPPFPLFAAIISSSSIFCLSCSFPLPSPPFSFFPGFLKAFIGSLSLHGDDSLPFLFSPRCCCLFAPLSSHHRHGGKRASKAHPPPPGPALHSDVCVEEEEEGKRDSVLVFFLLLRSYPSEADSTEGGASRWRRRGLLLLLLMRGGERERGRALFFYSPTLSSSGSRRIRRRRRGKGKGTSRDGRSVSPPPLRINGNPQGEGGRAFLLFPFVTSAEIFAERNCRPEKRLWKGR